MVKMVKVNEVIILCGGKGSRILPLTKKVPKPMLKIGGIPLLEHIIRNYQYHGFKTAKLLLGYKGNLIKKYFIENKIEGISIEFYDTGLDTNTSDRIWYMRNKTPSCFALCYGDVIGDVNFTEQIKFHKKKGKIMNLATIPLRSTKGIIMFDKNNIVTNFVEKPQFDHYWVNAGFFIINSEIFDNWNWTDHDFSKSVIPHLCKTNNASCYPHKGFWNSMDTEKEFTYLNDLWNDNNATWAMWKNSNLNQ